jgi:pimeloyl-ACP methyl ester carboxylesterase
VVVVALVVLAVVCSGCAIPPTQLVAAAPAPASLVAPPPRLLAPPPSLLVSPGRRDADCPGEKAACKETIRLSSGWLFTLYANFPTAGSPIPTRAVVVVPGGRRNAEGYFGRMLKAADEAGVADHVMVVATWFKADDDRTYEHEARWDEEAWKAGEDARQPAGLSSFAVMDDLLASLADRRRFPNLRHITVAGHSSGGQFAQRYAALGQAPDQLPWVGFNFVSMNPSSYLYFDEQRPGADGRFGVPERAACPDYNRYKYGMEGRTGYLAASSAAQAAARYASRPVTVLNGERDDYQNGDMDDSCPAMLEGPNRKLRGRFYVAHFLALHPSAPHHWVVVPGVDHDGSAMFDSPLSWPALFGSGSDQPN